MKCFQITRFLKLFTYSCLHWVFVVAHGVLWSWHGGPLSNGGVWASHCRVQALGAWASGLVAHGTWDLSRPRLEPMSLSLVGRFLTTGPPGKSQITQFNEIPSFVFSKTL